MSDVFTISVASGKSDSYIYLNRPYGSTNADKTALSLSADGTTDYQKW